jgi:predicted MPP superfamily phosphohydrolase
MRTLRTAALATLALGAYSVVEPYLYRLTNKHVPVNNRCPPLSLLHISDTHMQGGTRMLATWLKALPQKLPEIPDFVLATGDLIEDNDGIDPLVDALSPLRARLGCFYVLGSHDYFVPTFRAFTKYFGRLHGPAPSPPADTARLERGLVALGWRSLSNTTLVVDTVVGPLRLTGIDDPYIKRHRTEHIHRLADDVAAIGLMHSPDVLSEWFGQGFDLVLAGHTHGGQVRVPGVGALVTNCSLPNALASGLHRVNGGWLHVSPGLGVGKYSRVRFACRPEATLLRLEPERDKGQ